MMTSAMASTTVTDDRALVASVENLQVSFPVANGWRTVVRGVSFDVREGDRIAIVGESGSGKTMVGSALLGISPALARIQGNVRVGGIDPQRGSRNELKQLRGGRAAMVFQDPLTSLNPVRTIGSQLVESIRRHQGLSVAAAKAKAIEVMGRVGIPAPGERLGVYPHELSGGLRQRVVISLAIANDPLLLIADEPTTALDATIQAQILEVFRTGVQGQSMLLITHDLAVAAEVCNRVMVMYAGQIVEEGPIEQILRAPRHPYTRGLLAAVPSFGGGSRQLVPIPGGPPTDPGAMVGCRFAPRCPAVHKRCTVIEPERIDGVACWLYQEEVAHE